MFSMDKKTELNSLVAQRAALFELLVGERETLPAGRDTLRVLDSGLGVVDGVRGFDFKGDRLSSESLNEDLHGGLWEKSL